MNKEATKLILHKIVPGDVFKLLDTKDNKEKEVVFLNIISIDGKNENFIFLLLDKQSEVLSYTWKKMYEFLQKNQFSYIRHIENNRSFKDKSKEIIRPQDHLFDTEDDEIINNFSIGLVSNPGEDEEDCYTYSDTTKYLVALENEISLLDRVRTIFSGSSMSKAIKEVKFSEEERVANKFFKR